MEGILGLIAVVIVLAVVFWLLAAYVAPALPAPWGKVLVALVALLCAVALLSWVFGGHPRWGHL